MDPEPRPAETDCTCFSFDSKTPKGRGSPSEALSTGWKKYRVNSRRVFWLGEHTVIFHLKN